MFASKSERKVRYSIRKFSVGVASVVVASLFLGGVVHAEVVGGGNSPIPQTVSSGDKEYEDAVRKVNIELSEYMDKSLDKLNRSASGFSETLTKIKAIVDKYRDKIDSVSTKSMVEELGRQAKKEIDEEIKLFQNNSDNQIPPKNHLKMMVYREMIRQQDKENSQAHPIKEIRSRYHQKHLVRRTPLQNQRIRIIQ
ncbi:surface protein PspC [Streptococcus pneumoniae]|nr:surface protein PspC [Streptococcus pneumoniae]